MPVLDRRPKETQGVLPLVVAGAGHRDLRPSDVTVLEKRVREVFDEFNQRYPHTPLLVITGLAEGADRLIARVALAAGARLCAVLPYERARFEEAFHEPRSRRELADLLARADTVIELPGAEDEGTAYRRLAAFLNANSQVLLALWDGVESGLPGSTVLTVQYRLKGVPEDPLTPSERGSVIHIVTPRINLQEPPGTLERRVLHPLDRTPDEAAADFDTVCSRIETFNADASRLAERVDKQRKESRRALAAAAGDIEVTPAMHWAAGIFSWADAMAIYYARIILRMLRLLFAAVFAAATAFNTYTVLDAKDRYLNTFLGASALAWCVFAWARRRQYQRKFEDYRALAEGLRVQFFFDVAGIPNPAVDYYLRKQAGELSWIRSAMRGRALQAHGPETGAARRQLEAALRGWIEDQLAYFRRASHRDERHYRILTRLSVAFTLAAAVLSIAQFLIGPLYSPVIFGIGLGLTSAGSLYGYADKRALSQQARQYARMSGLFGAVRSRLAQWIAGGRFDEARRAVLDLGAEALEESGDWLLMHRERPLDVPR